MANDETANKSTMAASSRQAREGAGTFSTTDWSVVVEVAKSDPAASAEALEQLCRAYWYPLYAFVRRCGSSLEEAEDLTQGFFAHLIEKEALKRVGREKGKFRTFLLTSLSNYISNESGKQRTQKRGGKNTFTPWEEIDAEQRYLHEPVESHSPEKLFDRRWAFTVVEQVLGQLRKEYESGNKLPVFAELQSRLTQESDPASLATAAARLNMSEGALKVALHRLRRRFGEHLRAQIATTVASVDQVEEELRHLLAAISA
jgi:RNA polymerase sigma-70 factor (ECF subfamily)